MNRTRSIVLVAGALLAAFGATAATAAAKSSLYLKSAGAEVKVGSALSGSWTLRGYDECSFESPGTVLVNNKPTDKLQFEGENIEGCYGSGRWEGGEISLTAAGKAKIVGAEFVIEKVECRYDASKATGTYKETGFGNQVVITLSGTGKEPIGIQNCPKTYGFELTGHVYAGGNPLEASLTPPL